MKNPTLSARLANIDGLRGLAILLVLMTHTWVFFGAPSLSVSVGGHPLLLASIPAVGHVGVNLFLVISGFSLAWPLMKDDRARARYSLIGFMKRRVQRIMPPYYASIALIYLLAFGFDFVLRSSQSAPMTQHPPVFAALTGFGGLWPHLFLIHNLWPQHVSSINGSYWSLALEFQLYLLFPLLFEAMRRWGVWRVAASVLVIQLAYRWSLEWSLSAKSLVANEFVLPAALPGRMFEFAAGMAAAAVVARHLSPLHRFVRDGRWVAPAIVGWLGVAFFTASSHRLPDSMTDILWALGFVALVVTTSVRVTWLSRIVSCRPAAALGFASYSIYLLHQPLIERLGYLTLLRFRPGAAFLIGMALLPVVVGLCLILFVLVEKPSLGWMRRKPPFPPTQPSVAPETLGGPLKPEPINAKTSNPKICIVFYHGNNWDWVRARQRYLMHALSERYRIIYLDGTWSRRGCLTVRHPEPGVTVVAGLVSLFAAFERRSLGWLAHLAGKLFSVIFRQRGQAFVFWNAENSACPFRYIPHDRLIFDCIDPSFSENPAAIAAFHDRESGILRAADIVFASASSLVVRCREENQNVYLLNNACEPSDYAPELIESSRRPSWWPRENRPIAAYLGSLDQRFDFALAKAVAKESPKIVFILAGNILPSCELLVDELRALPNVICPGWVSVEDGRHLMAHCAVGIIPFRAGAMNDAVNPVKLYAYALLGKPIVGTPIRELMERPEVALIGRSPGQFASHLAAVIDGSASSPAAESLRAFALRNTWADRAASVFDVLHNYDWSHAIRKPVLASRPPASVPTLVSASSL